MRRRIHLHTTLGELIAAVSEEVEFLTLHKRKKYILVAYILRDLFTRRHVRFRGAA